MFRLPEDISLYSVEKGQAVKAKLVELTRDLAARKVDGEWWRVDAVRSKRVIEADHHWRWRKIVGERNNQSQWQAICILGPEDAIEGAAIYRIDASSQLDPGQRAIYVDRRATAPRNRRWLVDAPKYRGVGSNLLLAIARHSFDLGFNGRIVLSSLPDERTRDFYGNRGLTMTAEDPDGMIEYELTAAKAAEWLTEEGYLE